MDCKRDYVLLHLVVLLQSLNRNEIEVEGFKPKCQSAGVNPSATGSLTLPTCEPNKIVFRWDLGQQSLSTISFKYICVNPEGDNVSTPTLSGRRDSMAYTTLTGINASAGATCWFSACYVPTPLVNTFTVPPASCIVQTHRIPGSSFISPSVTLSAGLTLTSSTLIYLNALTTSGLLPSQLVPSPTESKDNILLSSSWAHSSIGLQNQPMHPSQQVIYEELQSQYNYVSPSAPLIAVTLFPSPYLALTPSHESSSLINVQTSCLSSWCSNKYIVLSIVAVVCLVLLLLTVAVIYKCVLWQRKRRQDFQLMGCKANEKLDPDFKPTLTSNHIFSSVESVLDTLQRVDLPAYDVEIQLPMPCIGDYLPSGSYIDEDSHSMNISTSECTERH